MNKSDARDSVARSGFSAYHPKTGGAMSLYSQIVSVEPMKERRYVRESGNCTPNDGWELEYEGER